MIYYFEFCNDSLNSVNLVIWGKLQWLTVPLTKKWQPWTLINSIFIRPSCILITFRNLWDSFRMVFLSTEKKHLALLCSKPSTHCAFKKKAHFSLSNQLPRLVLTYSPKNTSIVKQWIQFDTPWITFRVRASFCKFTHNFLLDEYRHENINLLIFWFSLHCIHHEFFHCIWNVQSRFILNFLFVLV